MTGKPYVQYNAFTQVLTLRFTHSVRVIKRAELADLVAGNLEQA